MVQNNLGPEKFGTKILDQKNIWSKNFVSKKSWVESISWLYLKNLGWNNFLTLPEKKIFGFRVDGIQIDRLGLTIAMQKSVLKNKQFPKDNPSSFRMFGSRAK